MAAPGYSVTDLIQAVGKVKDVFEAFFNEHSNAPQQLRELRDELQRLQDELFGLKQIELETGKSYTGRDALQRTLSECEAFLKNHKSALSRQRGIFRRGDTALGVLETGLFAFEQENYERLLDHLNRRRIELVGYYVLLLLQRSLSPAQPQSSHLTRRDSAASVAITRSRTSVSPERVNECIRDLRSIGNTLTRLGGAANTDVDRQLQGVITRLSDLFPGLPTGLLPQMRAEEFTRNSHQQLWQKIIETGSGVSKYSSGRRSETVSRTCTVIIARGRDVIEAAHYTMISDSIYRYCYFFDRESEQVMVHYLPRDCHPYTHHSRFNKPLQITFKTATRVVPASSADQEEDGQPVYHFPKRADFEAFQSDARNRDLIRTLDVAKISSPNANQCHAQNAQVKLWRSRRDMSSTSITFRARQQTMKNLDFRLRYLRVTPMDNGQSCRLDFVQDKKRRQSSRGSLNTIATSSTQKTFDANEYVRVMQYIKMEFVSAEVCNDFISAFKESQAGLSRPPSTLTSISTLSMASNWTFGSSPLQRTSTAGTTPLSPGAAESDLSGIAAPRLPPPDLGSTATGLVSVDAVVSREEQNSTQQAPPDSQAEAGAPQELQTARRRSPGITPGDLLRRISTR